MQMPLQSYVLRGVAAVKYEKLAHAGLAKVDTTQIFSTYSRYTQNIMSEASESTSSILYDTGNYTHVHKQ